jgi:hypothetical protein
MLDAKKILGALLTLALFLIGITKGDIFSPQVADFLSQNVTTQMR